MKYDKLLLAAILLLSACSPITEPVNNTVNEEPFVITNEGSFSPDECLEKGFQDKVIMLESKYCGHCKATLPDFKKAAADNNITPIILDLSDQEQRARAEAYGVMAQYTPTYIIGCDYYVGSRDLEVYNQWLSDFNENQ